MTFRSDVDLMFRCDYCRRERECRFDYVDPALRDLLMVFCGLDCLTSYVETAKASSHSPLEKGGLSVH